MKDIIRKSCALLCLLLTLSSSVFAQVSAKPFHEVKILVPLYEHIVVGQNLTPFNLASSIIIRNTSLTGAISVMKAHQYDSDGKLLRELLPQEVKLAPLASHGISLAERQVQGGAGGSVIVEIKAAGNVTALPLVESVMIGAASAQGISFTSRAQVLEIR